MSVIDIRDPSFVFNWPPSPDICFQCVFMRETKDGFELVAQWVNCTDTGDFTFDEQVVASAATPFALALFYRSFEMPMPPRLRET